MSETQSSSQVTVLLNDWRNGDKTALDALVPLVYEELRSLANAQLQRDYSASIQCTELVSEAYLKLIDVKSVDWANRNHFFSLASRIMRRILVERYRARNTDKRGRNLTIVTYEENVSESQQNIVELGPLDEALTKLEELDSRQAEIVTMRFFGGLKSEEIADVLSISVRTVKREWSMARLWLFKSLQQSN